MTFLGSAKGLLVMAAAAASMVAVMANVVPKQRQVASLRRTQMAAAAAAAFGIRSSGIVSGTTRSNSFATASAELWPSLSSQQQQQQQRQRSKAPSRALSMTSFQAPFPTWSFDKPCETMEWTEVPSVGLEVSSDESKVDSADLVILGVYAPASSKEEEEDDEDNKEEEAVPPVLTGMAKKIDDATGGALTDMMTENYKAFKNGAKVGTMTPTLRFVAPGAKPKRYVLLGLGKEKQANDEKKAAEEGLAEKIAKAISTKCDAEKKVATCALVLPSSLNDNNDNNKLSMVDLSSAFYSSLYSDNRYRTGDKKKLVAEDLQTVVLVKEGDAIAGDAPADQIAKGLDLARGVYLSKDIVNSPHNVLNSVSLAATAKRIAADSQGTIKCNILNKKECEKRGMGAYLGVARGSETEPQFIHLSYIPKGGAKPGAKLGIIGKGLLFDTGGYNIKKDMMELMKFDCGGAAAVLGAARAVGALAPPGVEAHFVVAACENMINDRAMVPSDILTASNGKTIEVLNTDAEGRLTLADALVFCDKEVGCDRIIELSTLTGACMVALGKNIAGLWTANDDLASDLAQVSSSTLEKIWRMPLPAEYKEQLESKVADLKNIGTRWGGAITAALFLQNFVSGKKPFAHIDIAGPVWNDKSGTATGFGARLVTEWICSAAGGGATESKE